MAMMTLMNDPFFINHRGCELGHMASCHNVSLMLAKGEGCEQDLEKSQM